MGLHPQVIIRDVDFPADLFDGTLEVSRAPQDDGRDEQILVRNNLREFRRVPGLATENWSH